MNNHFVAGILAGLIAALLAAPFAAPVLAALGTYAIILVYLAPLPILIAALCWKHQAGLVATLISAIALLLLSDWAGGLLMLAIGLPAWGLAYLVLLGRRTETGMEWYPPGRILAWIVAIASVLTAITILSISEGSYEQYLNQIEDMRKLLEPGLQAAMPQHYDPQAISAILRVSMPVTQGLWITLVLILNVWLATQISVRMKRMPRPWPFIPASRMPPVIVGLAFISIVLPFLLGGLPGLFSMGVVASSLLALMLQGLMFIHFITWGNGYRSPILFIVYLAIPLAMTIGQGLPLYGLIGLGVADVLFNIRKKAEANGSPPANI